MRKVILLTILFVTVPLLVSGMGKKEEGQPLTFEVLESSAQGGTSEPMNLIAKTEDDFKYIWDLTHRAVEPKPEMPEVDFNRDMVGCVMMGEKTSSGYSVDVTNIVEYQDSVVIYTAFDETGGMLAVMTYPYEIVKFPKTSKKVVFQKESEK